MPRFNPPLMDQEVDAAFPGRFTNIASVFAGGQGTVFRCLEGNVPVAMKIYAPDPTAQIQERTGREVAALQNIACPHVVALHDHGQVAMRGDQCHFVATAFVAGDTLGAAVAGGPMLLPATAQVAVDVATAIDAMWEPHRVVHRDIKPSNVMLEANGRAVVIDLGIARHTALADLTTAGVAWGTVGYMSPEQAYARRALTCKSDVYALGVLALHLLLGHHPTGGDQARLFAATPDCQALVPTLPAATATFIASMLSRNAVRRPLPMDVVHHFSPLI